MQQDQQPEKQASQPSAQYQVDQSQQPEALDQDLVDAKSKSEVESAMPFAPPEKARVPFNIGAILSMAAVLIAIIGCLLPLLARSQAGTHIEELRGSGIFGPANGLPYNDDGKLSFGQRPEDYSLSIVQMVSISIFSPSFDGLPTIWFFSTIVLLLIAIASAFGTRSRTAYLTQIILPAFAVFWGMIALSTLTSARQFQLNDQTSIGIGFWVMIAAFTLAIISGLFSLRWSERAKRIDTLKKLYV